MAEKYQGDPDKTTLTEAKDWLRSRTRKGAFCPCCTQLAKIYRRKFDSTMAGGLIWLYRESGSNREWVEVQEVGPKWLLSKGGTLATIRHWGLIEERPDPKKKGGRTAGVWRITSEGQDYVKGLISIPKYVVLYDNRLLRTEGKQLAIREALGDKFNYDELMRS